MNKCIKKYVAVAVAIITTIMPTTSLLANTISENSSANTIVVNTESEIISISENEVKDTENKNEEVYEEEISVEETSEEETSKEEAEDGESYYTISGKYPSEYDGRKEGYVNRSSYQDGGTCWHFAAISVAEANIVKRGIGVEDTKLSSFFDIWYYMYGEDDRLGNYTKLDSGILQYGLSIGTNSQLSLSQIYNVGGTPTDVYQMWSKYTGPVNYSECKTAGAYAPESYKDYNSSSNEMINETFRETYRVFNSSVPSVDGNTSRFHLKEWKDLKVCGSDTSFVEDVKELITEYGAVSAAVYDTGWGEHGISDIGYYTRPDGEEVEGRYCQYDKPTTHAISIIGWDDDYPVDGFGSLTPPGKGAFLVKDNYGNYYYRSYYDRSYESIATVDFDSVDTYQNNYLYDASAVYYSNGQEGYKRTCYANVFECKSDTETLDGYMIHYISDRDKTTPYTISVIVNPSKDEDGNYIFTSTPALKQSGELDGKFYGMKTIPFEKKITLKKGDKFAIVYKGEGLRVGRSYEPREGICFYGDDETNLSDFSKTDGEFGTPMLRALTNNGGERIDATQINVSDYEVNLTDVETTKTITATVYPSNVTMKGVSFASENRNVATVDGSGKIIATGYGETNILVSSADGKVTQKVKVTVSCTDFALNCEDNMYMGESYQITNDAILGQLPSNKLTYKSGNTSVVTVDENGNVTPVGKGTANITVTLQKGVFTEEQISKTVSVIVYKKVESVETVNSSIKMSDIENIDVSKMFKTLPEDAVNAELTYKVYKDATCKNESKDFEILGSTLFAKDDCNKSVHTTGTTVYVKATSENGKSAVIVVNVYPTCKDIQFMLPVGKTDISLGTGEEYYGQFTITGGSSSEYSISSADESVVKAVMNGMTSFTLNGIKDGKTTVTVKALDAGNYQKSITVIVGSGDTSSGGMVKDDTTDQKDQDAGNNQKPEDNPTDTSVPEEKKELKNGEKVSIGKYTYKCVSESGFEVYLDDCDDMEDVIIPDTITVGKTVYKVTGIGKKALHWKDDMVTLEIGNNVKVIEESAVEDCDSLEEIIFGKNVTVVKKNAFSGCNSLTKVKMNGKVKAIGNKAFEGCTSLKSVTIPSSVTKIGSKAFYKCGKLKAVTIKSTFLTKSRVGKYAFSKINSKATIKVPKNKKTAYKKWLTQKGITKTMKIK